jgi:hypothetical protein
MSFSFEFVQTSSGSTTCALACMGLLQPPVRIHKDFDVLKLASRTAGLVARSKQEGVEDPFDRTMFAQDGCLRRVLLRAVNSV